MWTYNSNTFETLSSCIEAILLSLQAPEGSLSVTYSHGPTQARKTVRSLYYQRNENVLKYDWIFTELEIVPGSWTIRLGTSHTIIGGV